MKQGKATVGNTSRIRDVSLARFTFLVVLMWSWQKTWCQLPGISSGWKCRWSCIPDCKTLGRGTVKSVSRSPGFALTYFDILVYWLLAILTIRPWSAVVVLALWQVSCDFSVTKEASTWQARWICLAHLLGHCRLFLISNSCCSRRHSGKMSLGWPKQSRLENNLQKLTLSR